MDHHAFALSLPSSLMRKWVHRLIASPRLVPGVNARSMCERAGLEREFSAL